MPQPLALAALCCVLLLVVLGTTEAFTRCVCRA